MRTRRTHKLGRALAVTVVFATAAAAGASSAAAAKPTGPPVKLMLISEFSAGVTTPEIADGAKAAVKALNKKDGISGSPASLTICDTKNDPNTAADCGQQAVDGKYLAVVGIPVRAGREVLPHPPRGQHPDGREQRGRRFRLHQPGLVPLERRARSRPSAASPPRSRRTARRRSPPATSTCHRVRRSRCSRTRR